MRVRLTAAAPAALLSLVTMLSLTACGGSDSGDTKNISLRMTTWSSNEAHVKLFNEIAAEYKKSHPDIGAITFDALPVDSYTTTLTTQIAGGNAPDLAWLLEGSAPDFVASGALTPLDKVLDKPEELTPAACGRPTTRCSRTRSRRLRSASSSTPTW
jgi:multiple sugar transport system substrate-binding protein